MLFQQGSWNAPGNEVDITATFPDTNITADQGARSIAQSMPPSKNRTNYGIEIHAHSGFPLPAPDENQLLIGSGLNPMGTTTTLQGRSGLGSGVAMLATNTNFSVQHPHAGRNPLPTLTPLLNGRTGRHAAFQVKIGVESDIPYGGGQKMHYENDSGTGRESNLPYLYTAGSSTFLGICVPVPPATSVTPVPVPPLNSGMLLSTLDFGQGSNATDLTDIQKIIESKAWNIAPLSQLTKQVSGYGGVSDFKLGNDPSNGGLTLPLALTSQVSGQVANPVLPTNGPNVAFGSQPVTADYHDTDEARFEFYHIGPVSAPTVIEVTISLRYWTQAPANNDDGTYLPTSQDPAPFQSLWDFKCIPYYYSGWASNFNPQDPPNLGSFQKIIKDPVFSNLNIISTLARSVDNGSGTVHVNQSALKTECRFFFTAEDVIAASQEPIGPDPSATRRWGRFGALIYFNSTNPSNPADEQFIAPPLFNFPQPSGTYYSGGGLIKGVEIDVRYLQ